MKNVYDGESTGEKWRRKGLREERKKIRGDTMGYGMSQEEWRERYGQEVTLGLSVLKK